MDGVAADNMPGMDLDRGLREIGEYLSLIREINELEMLIASDGENAQRTYSLAGKKKIFLKDLKTCPPLSNWILSL